MGLSLRTRTPPRGQRSLARIFGPLGALLSSPALVDVRLLTVFSVRNKILSGRRRRRFEVSARSPRITYAENWRHRLGYGDHRCCFWHARDHTIPTKCTADGAASAAAAASQSACDDAATVVATTAVAAAATSFSADAATCHSIRRYRAAPGEYRPHRLALCLLPRVPQCVLVVDAAQVSPLPHYTDIMPTRF